MLTKINFLAFYWPELQPFRQVANSRERCLRLEETSEIQASFFTWLEQFS